jgi:hypothetical protein
MMAIFSSIFSGQFGSLSEAIFKPDLELNSAFLELGFEPTF